MFKINSKFILDNTLVSVTYSSSCYSVFRDVKHGTESGYNNYQLQRLHKKGLLKPMVFSEIDEELARATYAFLAESQKRELNIKIALVNQFIAAPVKAGEEANQLIGETLKLLGEDCCVGESTVRGWVTKYRKSQGNVFSLLEGRRKKPNFAS
ncbi:hypothetical protein [Pseudoalteromonas shioyasakiensis]|uniref:hypothetical protein n=1 Tax=Pseudoalteromonas shioyasakiensis TaxID=1190813 RepID=UPI002551FF7D|nr:hypothetical protein [Pseudoalteromonas shioyasakiensis]MDK9683644.1 hypothetical protein [Pseudoalteromonas shioyasakiensis]